MKRLFPKIISFIIISNFLACKEDCNIEYLDFKDTSIDLIDNSGKSPVSLKDSFVSAKSFGIYYQLNFEQASRPNSCEIQNGNSPDDLKIFTINKFDVRHPAGSEVTSAFTILNSDNLYPVSVNGASIKPVNLLLLNSSPLRDTIHQFIINGYRNDILISSDTTKAIFLNR